MSLLTNYNYFDSNSNKENYPFSENISYKNQTHPVLVYMKPFNPSTSKLSQKQSLKPFPFSKAIIGSHQLSPLHCAVISKDVKQIKKLCEITTNIDKADIHGWTPLHHAALSSQRIFDYLLSKNANKTIKNDLGGTPEDLRHLSFLPRFSFEIPPLLIQMDGEKKPLEVEEFKHLTEATYIQEMYVPPQLLYKEWLKLPQKEPSFINEIAPTEYSRHESFPYSLYIAPSIDPITKKNLGLGLYANEKIKKGTLICEYLGEKIEDSSKEENVDYLYEDIQALKYRNFGGMANDSFPNAVVSSIYSIKGVKRRFCLVSLKDIEVDSPIFIDYGKSSLKNRAHRELNINDIYSFLKTRNITHILKNIEGCEFKKELFVHPSKEDFYALLYFMNTPTTTLRLFFENHLSAEDILLLCQQPYFKKTHFVELIAENFFEFLKKFEKTNALFQKNFKEEILIYLQQGHCQSVYNFLTQIWNPSLYGTLLKISDEKMFRSTLKEMFQFIHEEVERVLNAQED